MGTHPIFESDFDCLTEYSIMNSIPKGGPLYFLKEKELTSYETASPSGRGIRKTVSESGGKTNEIIVNVKQEFTGVAKEYSINESKYNHLKLAQEMIKRLKEELSQTRDTLEMRIEENQRLQKELQAAKIENGKIKVELGAEKNKLAEKNSEINLIKQKLNVYTQNIEKKDKFIILKLKEIDQKEMELEVERKENKNQKEEILELKLIHKKEKDILNNRLEFTSNQAQWNQNKIFGIVRKLGKYHEQFLIDCHESIGFNARAEFDLGPAPPVSPAAA